MKIMKLLSVSLTLFAFSLWGQISPLGVRVTGTINDALGSPFTGNIHYSWPSHTDSSGNGVVGGSVRVPVVAGVIDVRLLPSLNGGPIGAFKYDVFGTNSSLTATYSSSWVIPRTTAALDVSVVAQVAGSGGGSGASATFQLTDLSVTRSITTPTILTIGAGCTPTTQCPIKFGDRVLLITSSATCTATSGGGTAFIWADNTPSIKCGIPPSGLAVTCVGCTSPTATSFPANTVPIYTWTAASGTWDASGGISFRAYLGVGKVPIPGLGCTSFTETDIAITMNCPGTGGYTPIWRPALSSGTGACFEAFGWTFNFTNAGYIRPGSLSYDYCGEVFNTAGGIGSIPIQWDGVTPLNASIVWGVNASAGSSLTWNVSCAPIPASGSFSALVFSTPNTASVNAPTVGQWTTTTIAVPMGSGAGSCANAGAGMIRILIQSNAFVNPNTPYFYGATI